jgi:hypothetical protein
VKKEGRKFKSDRERESIIKEIERGAKKAKQGATWKVRQRERRKR